MKYRLGYIIIISIFFSCKNGEKKQSQKVDNEPELILKTNNFEKALLDLRDVDVAFNESFKIKRFGGLKKNDSVYSFVMRLADDVTDEEVKKYSIGLRSYSIEFGDNKNIYLKRDFTPNLIKKQGAKYIILTQKIKNIRYFDSIEAYIYARKNWKASGRMGTVILKSILLEEKK